MNQRINALHRYSTAIFTRDGITAFLINAIRLTFSVITLALLTAIVKEWYTDGRRTGLVYFDVHDIYKQYIRFFFVADALINLILSCICMLMPASVVSTRTVIASTIDYIIGAVISYNLSMHALQILTDAKGYKGDTLDMINTIRRFIIAFIVIHMFLPYYIIVLGIIKRSQPWQR